MATNSVFMPPLSTLARKPKTKPSIAVIWIDWYAYHIARFRAIVDHCSALDVRGVELVGGAGVHQGFEFRQSDRDGLAVETLFPDQSWHGAGQFRIAVATWKKLNALDPAVVLVPGYYNAPALAAAVWARIRGRRTVLMTESTEQDHTRARWKEKAKAILIRALFGWAIAGGEPHLRYLAKLGFPIERVGRFYNVVDNQFYSRRADQCRAEQQAIDAGLPPHYFLYVGRLAIEKNILGLLEAFARYRAGGGTWSLVMAGDGPLRAEAAAYCEKQGMADQVRWMGMQSSEKLVKLYAFASCFVLPSTREPWGLVVNEALASGIPVLVSNRCGCVADLVEPGRNGWVFDPVAEGHLEQALWTMARLPEEERLRMGAASREVVSRYSPQAWAREVERIALAV